MGNYLCDIKTEEKMSLAKLLQKLQGKERFIDAIRFELPERSLSDESEAFYWFEKAFETRNDGVKERVLRPSLVARDVMVCRRFIGYFLGGEEFDEEFKNKRVDEKIQRVFDVGRMLHMYIQYGLHRGGVLKEWEKPIRIEEWSLAGTCDGIIRFKGADDFGLVYDEDMVLEIKTINEYGFGKLREPLSAHMRQASLYALGAGLKRIAFIYFNKNTSEMKVFVKGRDDLFLKIFGQEVSIAKQDLERGKVSELRVCENSDCDRAMECAFRKKCFGL